MEPDDTLTLQVGIFVLRKNTRTSLDKALYFWGGRACARATAMTTDVFTLAREETNNTLPAEHKKVGASTAFWMDPVASLSVDFKSVTGKKLLGKSVLPPSVTADQAQPSPPLSYGHCKNPSPELQKVLVIPKARDIVTTNDKLLDSGLNNISSFLKLPWMTPYSEATMYPFLDMAYKASFLAQASPFIYQQLAYQSLCHMAEGGSPEDRFFYLPQYVPTHISSQLESDFRIPASMSAALSPLHTLQGPSVHQQTSAFSTSLYQDALASAFHFDDCHLNNSRTKSGLPTSAKTSSTSNSRSACDPVNSSVPGSTSVSTSVDSRKTSKRSTASSNELAGFPSFYIGSLSSELDSLKQTSSSRQNRSSPDHCRAAKSLSPARTSVDRKVHSIPLDLSAKKTKGSSNRFLSELDFFARLNYGLQASDEKRLTEPPKVKTSLNSDKAAHFLQNQSFPGIRKLEVGSLPSKRSSESFSSANLGQQTVHVTNAKAAHTFSGKPILSKVQGQDKQSNQPKEIQPHVGLGSTSKRLRTDSFIPLDLGCSNGYLPYSITDTMSLQHMPVSDKGHGHHYPILRGHSGSMTYTSSKQCLQHRVDSQGTSPSLTTQRDLKELSNRSLSKSCNVEQNRGQEIQQKPSQTKKPEPEQRASSSERASNESFKSFCNPFNRVSESIVCIDMAFEEVDESPHNRNKSFLANQTVGQQGLQAPTSQPRSLHHKCSSPPPPSKEISIEDCLSPFQDLSDERTMRCARTSPEQFSRKKVIGAPCGSNSLARDEHGAEALDESDDEDQVNQEPSSNICASKECSYLCSAATQCLDGQAVGCSSHSDHSLCTSKTPSGDTPLPLAAGGVDSEAESFVSINQREQNMAVDSQSIDRRSLGYESNISDCLGQEHLLENNSRDTTLHTDEKNTQDIMDVQIGGGKDTCTGTQTEPFSKCLDSQPKLETEESCDSLSSWPSQEQCKENQNDETAAAGEAELADAGGGEGGWLDLCQQSDRRGGRSPPTIHVEGQKGAQPSSICVTSVFNRANELVAKDDCSTEKMQIEESDKEERQQAVATTSVGLVHWNRTSSVEGLSGLDPNMAANRKHMFSLEPFHQSNIGGRRMKRRRTEDMGTKNGATEDTSKQKSCIEQNGPCFKKPRLPNDDVKVHVASSPGVQTDSAGLWQPSHVASFRLRDKHQKLRETRRVSSLLPFLSDDSPDKPTGKHPCKTKHTREAAEEADEEGGDVEDRISQDSFDTCSPPLQPNLAVEPTPSELCHLIVNKHAGETLLQHAARLGDEEAVLYCLQLRLCNINHQDNAGYCALHEACTQGWFTIVRHLVEHGADVNCSAQDGTRPLHDAVANNHMEVVRFLLACGADPTLTSYSGRGLINMANSVSMETFLEEYLADLKGRPEGDSGICWDFYGSSVCEPASEDEVYNILADPPGPEEEKETEQRGGKEEFEFEPSDKPLPCYTLHVSPSTGPRNWLLLRDVLACLRMTPDAFRRHFPHLEVRAIPQAEFYCQTSLSHLWHHPAKQASSQPLTNDLLELVEATPKMAAMLGSPLKFMDSQMLPEPAPSPGPAPLLSSSSTGSVLPPLATLGQVSQDQSQRCAPVAAVERKVDASNVVTCNQVAPSHTHPKETINMSESTKNPANMDSAVREVQHLQNGVAMSTNCGTEENMQCGALSGNTGVNNSRSEDNKRVRKVMAEGLKKLSSCATEQNCQTLRDGSGHTVKMDAAWRRHLANVRVHIRDLGVTFAVGRNPSNVKVVDKVAETKPTAQKSAWDVKSYK
ncbi:uncharacterized protein LOC133150075 isoform X2 [Syngnathus typhle]|uniref:uncharacterized protein LOC133150075 isoform X2 n=1 Tax=Syngnathus typhle TaxID=161592 RepID=UPI002A699094|nr:uncharacterized protein LOC133150075 isoform X2 [Syngnathus typhle]